MSNNAANINTGKPKAGAYMWAAPLSTSNLTIPTDATTALGTGFVCLGYVSQDGVTQSIDKNSNDVVDWRGDAVDSIDGTRAESSSFTLIETNPASLKQYYGENNVVTDQTTGAITQVKHNGNSNDMYCYVWETVLKNGVIRRTVVPKAKVTDIGDIQYKSDDIIAYQLTIKHFPADSDNNTAFDYYGTPSSN